MDCVGAWGCAGDVILCLLPLVVLVVLTLWGSGLPAYITLPIAAAMMWLVRIAYLGSDAALVSGAVVLGVLEMFTPLTIIMGAMFLFETMEATHSLSWFSSQLKKLSAGHPVAEVMLIAFSFEYVVEGASGFGTPVALAAPILATMGHDQTDAIVVALIMNTMATIFGAAGTPIWFGFGNLGLTSAQLTEVGFRAQLLNSICALVIPLLGLRFLVSWKNIFRNIIFVYLSILGSVGPALGLSYFSSEFPSLIGGLIGLVITGVLVRFRIGIHEFIPEYEVNKGGLLSCFPCCHGKPGGEDLEDDQEIDDRLQQAMEIREQLKLSRGKSDDLEDESNLENKEGVFVAANLAVDPEMNHPVPMEELQREPLEHEGNGGPVAGDVEEKETADDPSMSQEISLNNKVQNISFKKGVNFAAESSYGWSTDQSMERSSITLSGELLRNNPKADVDQDRIWVEPGWLRVLSRTWCIWSSVVILIITRVPQIGVNELLKRQDPHFTIDLATLGKLKVSAALVFRILDIMGQSYINWTYETLFVPAYIPFIFVSILSMFYFAYVTKEVKMWITLKTVTSTVLNRLKKPSIALTFALILVQLIRVDNGSGSSAATIIGTVLANAFQLGWIAISFLIGGLGSFFSGSTTVSNLTFGGVQKIAAEELGVSVISMLSLQAVGATAGNMVCLNNIVNAKAVMNVDTPEGDFIKKTGIVFLTYYALATAVGGILFFAIIPHET